MRTIEVEEPEEANPNPLRPMRRLAAAVLAHAAADFIARKCSFLHFGVFSLARTGEIRTYPAKHATVGDLIRKRPDGRI